MKKALLTAALFAFAANHAQTTTTTTTTTTANGETKTASVTSVYDKKVTVSAYGSFPELNQAGISVEFLGNSETKSMNSKTFSYYSSKIVNVAYAMMDYEVSGEDAEGQGFVVEIGQRTYFLGKNSGPYMGNYLSYGNITFDEDDFGDDNARYSYFSFFSPELGFKIKAGRFAIDPFAGIMWKLEIKGKGGIDNRNVDEWTPRLGLKLGYEF